VQPTIVIVMGVSGSGKSTVARLLAARLAWPYVEGDDLHPAANIAKMAAGHPLDDADRAPWLATIRDRSAMLLRTHGGCVVACSALRRMYRDVLREAGPVRLAYLEVEREELHRRLIERHGHFMPTALLDSQLATLEPPGPEENPIIVHPVDEKTPQQAVEVILKALGVA
jgi:gluconokinase